MKMGKFRDVNKNNLENTLKMMEEYLEIYLKSWENHGKVMKFFQSRKVGTLLLTTWNALFTVAPVNFTGFNVTGCRENRKFQIYFYTRNILKLILRDVPGVWYAGHSTL